MSFNALNSIEHFIIHKLKGVNLNKVQSGIVAEETVDYGTVKWKYVQKAFPLLYTKLLPQ